MTAAIEALAASALERALRGEDATLALPGGLGLCARNGDGAFVGARDLAATLRVLASSHELLARQKTATQRELYYLHASFFSSQQESQGALARAQAALGGVPRHCLGIFAASRGWFAGACGVLEDGLSAAEAGGGAGVWVSGSRPRPIPASAVREEVGVRLDAGVRFLLVVEKECIFRRLVEDRIWAAPGLCCVIITGCGMGDHATRAFLRQLYCKAGDDVRVFGLSDCNPFGLSIMLNFAYGSRSSPEADAYNVPALEWLGLRLADVEAFALPAGVMQVTTSRDEARATALLRDPRVARDAELAAECARWVSGRRKCEVEALMGTSEGMGLLVRYLARVVDTAFARAAAAAAAADDAALEEAGEVGADDEQLERLDAEGEDGGTAGGNGDEHARQGDDGDNEGDEEYDNNSFWNF